MKMRVGVVFVVVLILAACGGAAPARPTPTPDPFVVFQTVRNDCGMCGTNSPAGGWEAADGRALVLNYDGGFVALFTDGTSMTGEWDLTGSQLCLRPAAGGEVCFAYRQRVDAMQLDDGIYIRQ